MANLIPLMDAMIEDGSRELSHLFGLAIPTTYKNGKVGEKILRFAKSPPKAVEVDMEAAFEQDTLHLEGIEDHLPGSPERIEMLRKYYELEEQKPEHIYTVKELRKKFADKPQLLECLSDMGEFDEVFAISDRVSASVITDEEFASELIEAVINFPLEAKQTPLVEWLRGEIKADYK